LSFSEAQPMSQGSKEVSPCETANSRSSAMSRSADGFDLTASSRRKASTSAGDSAIFGTSETSAKLP
jgi:hypothetical protein